MPKNQLIRNAPLIRYLAYFVSAEELFHKLSGFGTPCLERPITYTHVTFEYLPEEVDRSLFGDTVQIQVIGYGKNQENEGVKISLHSENPVLQKMYEDIAVPHITLSVSADGKAVNTSDLEFEPIEPFEITGVFGGFVDGLNTILTK